MATLAAEGFLEKFYCLRARYFNGLSALPALYKLALSFGMAAATGLSAQARVYLPWTPVPVTGQTLAVLIAGIALGARWGSLSQMIYITLGIAGMPWFSGFGSGAAFLLGPTGGYIAGFIPAAFLTGYFSEKHPGSRYFIPMLFIMLAANFLIIHLFGLAHFAAWAKITGASFHGFRTLLSASLLPFIPGDILKIAMAALIVKTFTPKERV